ncbi:hypothetical protein HD_0754 [[Haemophilus] ducreyi 35000HP]|uniref:Uncharacterized protein n=1 Tax=Haemophilus ducreyi (strain 35000HP / ATCC 700724) TaxID=233412 RepID=Q7VN32_HAEDU|nr:hypothetical protein HD_0754 [[Haemophilus] ducreyi 35000HP]
MPQSKGILLSFLIFVSFIGKIAVLFYSPRLAKM